MTDLSDREHEMPAGTHLLSDLAGLAGEWEKLGIDPDDFCRCAACHGYIEFFAREGDPICRCES